MEEKRFNCFPLGSVQAKGFLFEQLYKQATNFTDNMERYPDFSGDSGWLGGLGESWERGPYYTRGLVATAYALNDIKLIDKCKKWINYSLNAQDEDGNFYAKLQTEKETEELKKRREQSKNDWWQKMPMLMAIRDYYEAELLKGNNDKRVLPFFEKYFEFQYKNIKKRPLESWARARGADNIEVILWYMDKMNINSGWLLELCQIMISQTQDWVYDYTYTDVIDHVVNTTQGFKMPYIKYRLTGNEKDKSALKKGLEKIREHHGRIDDLPNADEIARDNLPTRGTETCAVVEGMLSLEICGQLDGESWVYDTLENYCYNSLPNCYDYDIRRHNYFQMQNQVILTAGYHGFSNDHGDSCIFGAPTGFDCCFSNGHMGYAKFIQNMWQKTADGIALVCYGPNKLVTSINGKKAEFVQETRYPYSDKIRLIFNGEDNKFKLYLRIPTYCEKPDVKVNGKPFTFESDDEYILINKTFNNKDIIDLSLPSEVEVIKWHYDTTCFKKGNLLFCLPIDEEIRAEENITQYREIKFQPFDDAKSIGYYPRSKWNYSVLPYDAKYVENSDDITINPKSIPCCLYVKAIENKDFMMKDNKAVLPEKKMVSNDDYIELKLIPYGSTRLKISVFPTAYKIPETDVKIDINVDFFEDYIVVDYNTLNEADFYLIKTDKESYKIEINKYKYSEHFNCREKYAISCDKNTSIIQMFAVKGNTIFAVSNIVTR